MKITDVRLFLTAPKGVYVKIETDDGISGYGESTINFFPRAAHGLLQDMKVFLVGEDPLRIERLWQTCFRSLFMRGGPVVGAAVSGIDMALWDIKGKYLNVPVYELLGGLARDKVRLYGHVAGDTPEAMAAEARKRVAKGITAIRFRGFHDTDAVGLHDHAKAVRQQIETLEAMRAAVGDDVDIILECHGRYSPEWAIRLAAEVERFRPMFMEDPIRHENPQAMANLRHSTKIPLATGERAHSKWDFRELVVNGYIDYLRPDINHCGGISEMKKIASFAEIYYLNLVPHNTQGPLGMAACLHAAFAIDNVAIVEAGFVNHDTPLDKGGFVGPWPTVVDGYALPPQGPGLGVRFDEAAAEKTPVIEPTDCYPPKLKAIDGSVRDW